MRVALLNKIKTSLKRPISMSNAFKRKCFQGGEWVALKCYAKWVLLVE